jgi:hypothetical protein
VTEKNLIDETPRANPGVKRARIRAVSLIQPWAWAVVHGPKWIENRVWWSDLRGDLVLHSSAHVAPGRFAEARERLLRIASSLGLELEVPHPDDLTYGAIIGRARVVDAILPGGFRPLYWHQGFNWKAIARYRANGAAWGAESYGGARTLRHELAGAAWHFADQYGYELADRRAYTSPLAWRGHQKGWTVPPELELELARRELGAPRPEGSARLASCAESA